MNAAEWIARRAPERIRLTRRRGARKPDGAVTVARPTKWGNPFVVGGPFELAGESGTVRDREHAVALYRQWVAAQAELQEQARRDLRGRDLACWCPLPGPCHADVLLRVANE